MMKVILFSKLATVKEVLPSFTSSALKLGKLNKNKKKFRLILNHSTGKSLNAASA